MMHTALLSFSMLASLASAGSLPSNVEHLIRKQVPADPKEVKTITSPNGVALRYKEPEKEGVCETTPGVNSYSGYVDVNADSHVFFWFFEARHNPETAPITLWLNGGPGSDSLIGLFEELGPCYVTANGTAVINPYAWNEASNLLFLSQPVGVGFSYQDEVVGVLNQSTGLPVNSSTPDGRYGVIDIPDETDTSELAAKATWEILQGFLDNLPVLDSKIKSRSFNLWTESYGGHWGPAFYRHFYEQNLLIQNGSSSGVELNMHSLGIINGLINERIQAPYYPEFAHKNTYGIQCINETVYEFAKMAYYFPNGCRDFIDACAEADRTTGDGKLTCSKATAICSSLVEDPFYEFSGRNGYDIRAKDNANVPPGYWADYLNSAVVQNAIGVNLNYTSSISDAVYNAFDISGDFVYPNLLQDLETLLGYGVRIALIYGDADYICNWFGGEAISLTVNYTHAAEFRKSGYAPVLVDGTEYGESRQYGNFSFTRVYESGHEVPYYQPRASLEIFRRVLGDLVVSDGTEKVTPTYESEGTANATHTESWTTWYTGRVEPTRAG